MPKRKAGAAAIACRAAAGVLAVVFMLLQVGPAQASLQSELNSSRKNLEHAEKQEGVLTTTLARYHEEIGQLEGQVAALRTSGDMSGWRSSSRTRACW